MSGYSGYSGAGTKGRARVVSKVDNLFTSSQPSFGKLKPYRDYNESDVCNLFAIERTNINQFGALAPLNTGQYSPSSEVLFYTPSSSRNRPPSVFGNPTLG